MVNHVGSVQGSTRIVLYPDGSDELRAAPCLLGGWTTLPIRCITQILVPFEEGETAIAYYQTLPTALVYRVHDRYLLKFLEVETKRNYHAIMLSHNYKDDA